jgi:hypothetical protein
MAYLIFVTKTGALTLINDSLLHLSLVDLFKLPLVNLSTISTAIAVNRNIKINNCSPPNKTPVYSINCTWNAAV